MPLKGLKRDLDEGIKPIYVFVGEAAVLVDSAVAMVVSAVLPVCGLPAFNHGSFQASDGGVLPAVSTARTLPMMADRRLVVLRGVQDASAAALTALVEYVSSPNVSTVLVVTAAKFPKPTKGQPDMGRRLVNAAKKVGVHQSLGAKSVRPTVFASERASANGKRISRSAAELLVQTVGDDLSALAHEVDKLALYVGDDSEIPEEAVVATCALLADAVIWDLTTAVGARDPDTALAALHRLLDSGDATRRLLSMVQWRMRTLLEVADMKRRGTPDDQILRKHGGLRYSWRSVAPTLGSLAPAHEILRRIAQANLAMNQHRAGDRRILEALVLQLLE